MATNYPLIVIVGPTASGKTSLGIEVALRHNGEIVCADSRTVYKGMDIGTAKPTQEEQAAVRHHLIDIVDPDKKFTAADFQRLANEAIEDITSRGKLPIMVGGTGLYADSILFNYEFGKPADLQQRAELSGLSVAELQKICSDKNIDLPFNTQNKRHLIRSIELSGLPKRENLKLRAQTLVVGITTDKEILESRITHRAEKMFESGVIEEAENLGTVFGWQNEAMTGNIYPIIKKLLDNELNREEAIQEFIRSDKSLAKRQRTWFKRNPYIFWSDEQKELLTKVDQFVANLST